MQCILHIGTEKTGTTLLQKWLYRNQATLSQQGIYLSNLLEKINNRRLVARFQGYLDDWAFGHRIVDQAAFQAHFADFDRQFIAEIVAARRAHHTFLITSEHFHSRMRDPVTIAALRDFLAPHFTRIKVVCYFREQAAMALSLYSTAVRSGMTTTLSDFLRDVHPNNDYFNCLAVARRWRDAFGRENCAFRIYDRQQFVDQDLRRDLASCIQGIDFTALDQSVTTANQSIGLVQAEVYRRINEVMPFWRPGHQGKNPTNRLARRVMSTLPSVRAGRLYHPDVHDIPARFRAVNQAFFDEFFGGEWRFPDSLAAGAVTDEEAATLAAQARILGQLGAEMVQTGLFQRLLSDRDLRFLFDLAGQLERSDDGPLSDEAARPVGEHASDESVPRQRRALADREAAARLLLLVYRARPGDRRIARRLQALTQASG